MNLRTMMAYLDTSYPPAAFEDIEAAPAAVPSVAAGAPGSFTGDVPANITALRAITFDPPPVAFETGQWVELANGAIAYYDGYAWRTGKAPAPAPVTTP